MCAMPRLTYLSEHNARMVGIDDQGTGNLVRENEVGKSQNHRPSHLTPTNRELPCIPLRAHIDPAAIFHDLADELDPAAEEATFF